jgi:hypothetical protein
MTFTELGSGNSRGLSCAFIVNFPYFDSEKRRPTLNP